MREIECCGGGGPVANTKLNTLKGQEISPSPSLFLIYFGPSAVPPAGVRTGWLREFSEGWTHPNSPVM